MVFQCECGDVANYEKDGKRVCYDCFYDAKVQNPEVKG